MARDASAIAILDDAIELWSGMWLASAARDLAVEDGVRALQRTCADKLVGLRGHIEQLCLLPTAAAPAKKLGAAAPER